jgi:hypothetical protein
MSRRLLERYAIKVPLKAYHEHNAQRMRPVILDQLKDGARLALVSDAGMPLISDPGYKLVREAIEEGLAVHAVPGPRRRSWRSSCPACRATASPLPASCPTAPGARRTVLARLAGHDASLIFFETATARRRRARRHCRGAGRPAGGAGARTHQDPRGSVARDGQRGGGGDRGARRGQGRDHAGRGAAANRPTGGRAEIDAALAAALDEMTPGKAASQLARRSGGRGASFTSGRWRSKGPRCRRRLSAGAPFAAATSPRRRRLAVALQGLPHRGPPGAHAAGRDRHHRAARPGHACLRRGEGAPDPRRGARGGQPRQARRLVGAARYWLHALSRERPRRLAL